MKTRTIVLVVFMLTVSGLFLIAEEADAEAKARVEYDAADKAAKAAEAAIAPLKDAMQKADKAYADAKKAADTKRQQATDAKNLSGEQGVKELKQAEDNLPVTIKALTDATNAKPPLDKALADAKAATLPLQQAYDAAEKAAKEAEAMAKVAVEAANKLDDEAKRATVQATTKRRSSDAAKASLARAQQSEQNYRNQVNAAPKKQAEAEMQKKAADDALVSPKNQLAAATTAYQAAEQAALAAEMNAKLVTEAEKQQAAAEAAARRKAADTAKTAMAQTQQTEQQAQLKVNTAAKNLADVPAQKKAADDALASAKNQVAAANGAYQAAEQAAQGAEAAAKAMAENAAKSPEEKKKAGDEASAKRKATEAAKTALIQAQQNEQQAKAKADAAAKNLADAPVQKKASDDALVAAKSQVVTATAASVAAEKAAQEAEATAKVMAERAGRSQEQKQQATTDAAAKRKLANEAKAVLVQAQAAHQNFQKLADTAAQKLARVVAQKNMAEAALVNAKNQIAATTIASQVAEQAAQAAEKLAEEKNLAAVQAAAKRKAAVDAAAALAQVQQGEQQAQDKVNVVAKALADATGQKKLADDALAIIKNQVASAIMTSSVAEKVANEAEAAVKAVSGDVAKSPDALKKAADEAPARRKAADMAKAAFAQAQQGEQSAQVQSTASAQKLAEAETQKKAADMALENAKNQLTAATVANQTAQEVAKKIIHFDVVSKQANTDAKDTPDLYSDLALRSRRSRKRKEAVDAAAVLIQEQLGEQEAKDKANVAAKALTDATAQKKTADDALTNAKNQVAVANSANQSAEKVALEAEAAAKRIAADAAKAILAQALQSEQSAQVKSTVSAQKLAEVETQKKAADAVLATAKNQVNTAMTANQAAQEAAKEVIQLDTTSKQAVADAATKRKAANEAKAVLTPVQQKQEQAAIKANAAEQELARSETRKKAAEEGLENLKKRIAAAKQTHVADEEAAKAAEAAAAPLKGEAEKTRAAYTEAMKVSDDKRVLVEKAKAYLYRLVAGKQVASLMESSDPPKPVNRIDEIVFAKLNALGMKPVLCSDAVFVRRAYLDMTGTLPSAEEAKAFIQSSDKNKRVALIDRLLDQSAHVDYWAMKWSDILKVKAEFPVKVWPNAAQAYHRWIWESIARNKPYDQFVRELLTSSGSNFRVGPVNFYRAIQDKTPEGRAAAVGLALMGARIHFWPADRRSGMAVFFSQVGYKPTSEWKEEIVFWDPLNSIAVPGSIAPGVDAVAKAVTVTDQIPQALTNALTENGPLAAVFPDGTKTTIPPNRDPREVFADWLIRPDNPWFTKAIVNRCWAWVMGRGIIHEPDNIRDDNPPGNPELLAYLEKELVSSGYNLKHVKRLILTSTAYQFSSIQRSQAPEAKANFASYPLRRVEAEVLIDVLNNITGGSDLYTSAVPEPFTYIPKEMSAVELADGSVTSSFLTLFGRSARATGMESERVSELDSTQWLHMLNSAAIQSKLQSGPKLAAMISSGGRPNEIAERLYLTILSRFPTDADVKAAEEYAKSGVTKGNDVWVDLAWALINSPEFLLRH